MRLYLLRHADAVSTATSDHARELTSKGQHQARTVGEFCLRQSIHPELILTSPYRRTVQTADILTSILGTGPATNAPFLASGMDPGDALLELAAYAQLASLMLVGHQPDLGQLAATLLGLKSAENLPFGKASLLCVDATVLIPRAGSLAFFLPVKMMKAMVV